MYLIYVNDEKGYLIFYLSPIRKFDLTGGEVSFGGKLFYQENYTLGSAMARFDG